MRLTELEGRHKKVRTFTQLGVGVFFARYNDEVNRRSENFERMKYKGN